MASAEVWGSACWYVCVSWLSRAIETAWLVLDELDSLWLPLIKSWRLNERMYGALTGRCVGDGGRQACGTEKDHGCSQL